MKATEPLTQSSDSARLQDCCTHNNWQGISDTTASQPRTSLTTSKNAVPLFMMAAAQNKLQGLILCTSDVLSCKHSPDSSTYSGEYSRQYACL
ncbi:hypothetical protein F2P79_008172 [Pimephales promelas]|nr:hypothetical protein F2P79_008172 [Pimephales promelas]